MDDEHLRKEQLFPLLHALRERPLPPVEGEGADPELARVLRDLPDPFRETLAVDQRLGPETIDRLVAHSRACTACRSLLVEDGPAARPTKTEAELKSAAQAESDRKELERKGKVRRFWLGALIGAAAFFLAQATFQYWRDKNQPEEVAKAELRREESAQDKRIDPVFLLGMGFVVVAAFALTDAYLIAKELWIDFTKWKRAVPVIGRAWADRDKQKGQE